MLSFDDIISGIEKNKLIKESGGITSILPPFSRLAEKYGGFTRGSITAITAGSGVGKTKFVKYMTVFNVFMQIRQSSIKPKIFYFALEESETDFWLSFISMYIALKYNESISVSELKSIGSYTVNNETFAKVKEAEKFIRTLQDYVEVIDYIRNPTGIKKHIKNYFDNPNIGEYVTTKEDDAYVPIGYRYKSDDTWVFFVLDHVSLLSNEFMSATKKRLSSYETIDYMVKDITLDLFSKKFKMANIIVHQQTPASEKAQYTSKGSLVEERLEPSLEELHLNKGVQQDYEIVLGLFNPSRYNIETHNNYDISILGSKYRSLSFLKDRHYGLENGSIGLHFNGATGIYRELPRPEEMSNPTKRYYEQFK